MMHFRLMKPWYIVFSQRFSWTQMHVYAWNRERVAWMVKLCTSTSKSNILALTIQPGILQKQKRSYKTHTMVVKTGENGASKLHFTRNSTWLKGVLLIKATVVLIMALNVWFNSVLFMLFEFHLNEVMFFPW